MVARGCLYRTGSSQRTTATLAREGARYRLTPGVGGDGRLVDVRRAEPRLVGVPQGITLRSGERFVPFHELPRGFLEGVETRPSRCIDWLERRWPIQAVVFLALLPVVFGGLRIVSASVVEVVVATEFLRSTGAECCEDERAAVRALRDSRLSPRQLARLRVGAWLLAERGGLDVVPEVLFRQVPGVPQALALPGGPVVVSEAMVRLLADDEKVLAVVAHELVHIQERHWERRNLFRLGLSGFLGLAADMIGFEAMAVFVEDLAAPLDAAYSREFELEADSLARDVLQASGLRPGALEEALEVVKGCGDPCSADGGFLATHPSLEERLEALRAVRGRRPARRVMD